jgi:uncharacterized protein YjbI with pentapeptide repeats
MSTYAGPFSGKDKRSLTRADVEERIQSVGNSELVNFAGEDLSEANLSNMKLTGIVFRRADLSGAILSGADLSKAILTAADLREANLSRAILSGAILSGAILNKANLDGAILNGADLDGAILNGTNLFKADLSGADLSGANLFKANLTAADLRKASLREADLTGAILREANLSRAILSGAILTGADLNNAIGFRNPQLSDQATTPGLYLRIIEEPLTLQHLADTLDSLIRLYVKLWLLEQQRFDDFVRYSTERDRSLEAEVPLPIAEMTYNSPWNGKINLDLSPKGVVEALQALVEMIAHFRIRKDVAEANLLSDQLNNQLKQEELKQARLTTIEHAFGTLEQGSTLLDKLSPGLSEEQKVFALQSLAKEVLHLASDATLEMTLIPPLSAEKQKVAETPPAV